LARQKIRENDKENALRVILKLLLNTISGIFFLKCNGEKNYGVESCPLRTENPIVPSPNPTKKPPPPGYFQEAAALFNTVN